MSNQCSRHSSTNSQTLCGVSILCFPFKKPLSTRGRLEVKRKKCSKKCSKKTTGSKIIKVFHCAASKPGAFHMKLLVPRIRSHSPLTSESPPNVPRLRHIYSRTFLSFVASDHLSYTERTQHEHLPFSLASPSKLWSSKGLQYLFLGAPDLALLWKDHLFYVFVSPFIKFQGDSGKGSIIHQKKAESNEQILTNPNKEPWRNKIILNNQPLAQILNFQQVSIWTSNRVFQFALQETSWETISGCVSLTHSTHSSLLSLLRALGQMERKQSIYYIIPKIY